MSRTHSRLIPSGPTRVRSNLEQLRDTPVLWTIAVGMVDLGNLPVRYLGGEGSMREINSRDLHVRAKLTELSGLSPPELLPLGRNSIGAFQRPQEND